MEEYNQIHRGVIKLGNGEYEYELPCYVLDNGNSVERVLSQREVVKLISGGRESGDLNAYLSAKSIQPFLPEKFQIRNNSLKIRPGERALKTELNQALNTSNILIFNAGGRIVNGILASDVVDICNAYLKARQLGELATNQAKLAEQSEIFISALAKTGIDAVVDEATGYQYFRKANDLQAKLNAYILEGYKEWTKTFPKEFFMHLYRLEGRTPPMNDQPYPKRFGKYVMQFVYDTLDPEIADYLRENNPNPEGKKHHHQKFNDFGYKALTDHLFSVLGIAKASINMEKFKENLSFAFPNSRTRKIARLLENKKKKNDKLIQRELFDYLPTPNNDKQFCILFPDDDIINEKKDNIETILDEETIEETLKTLDLGIEMIKKDSKKKKG